MKRLISALLILPPLILIVHYSSPLHFLLLMTIVVGMGLIEFYRMILAKGFPCWQWLGVALGMLLPAAFYVGGDLAQAVVAAIVVLTLMTGLLVRQDLTTSVQSAAFTMLGVLYVGWLLSYVILLRLLAGGALYIFYMFSVVWLGDAVAMYVGASLGRHKLAPVVSPGKTVEGAIGGFVGSLCGAVVGGFWMLEHLTLPQSLTIGSMLAVFGQVGDLSESLLKRGAGVKDSGVLIPGHGGILDKVDGILFGAPVLYYYLLFGTGQGLSS